jgi:hypothetical protein
MAPRPHRALPLTGSAIITAALLVAATPAESALQLVVPAPEAEKPVSCTLGRSAERPVPPDADMLPTDEPRVATREPAPDDKQVERSRPAPPELCPLRSEQEPAPTRGRP